MIEIVILGSSGFVGKQLVKSLRNRYRLRLFDLISSSENNFRCVIFKKKNVLKICETDLPNKKFVVVNLSAILGSKNFEKNYQNNVLSVKKLVKVLINKKNFLGLIHFSSISAERKASHYGITKNLSEKIVRKSKIPYIILQSEMIIGKGARSIEKLKRVSNLFPFVLPLPKGGNIIRYPIEIKKVINIVIDIIERKNFNNKTYSLIDNKIIFKKFLKKILEKKLFISVPTFFILGISKLIERLFENPIFTYDNAYGVVTDTKPRYPKYKINFK